MLRGEFLRAGGALLVAQSLPRSADKSVTLPMTVRDNRPVIGLTVTGPSVATQTIDVVFDTGGGALVIPGSIARQLGFSTSDPKGNFGLLDPLPNVAAGTVRIPIPAGRAAATLSDAKTPLPGMDAHGLFPVELLNSHAVTFDYPAQRFSLDDAQPGGERIPVGLAASEMPRIEVEIGGETYGFLLDTGASFCMLSQTVIDDLRAKHPDWHAVTGAYGPANMIGRAMEAKATMFSIPNARFGSTTLETMNVVSRPAGTYEKWMSAMMSGPIVGSIGGNVLRNFALRLDYPAKTLDARYTSNPLANELRMVPVVLTITPDGAYTVAAGLADAQQIAGARLIAVDGKPVTDLPLFEVQQLLRGDEGTSHHLTVAHGSDKPADVTLPVTQIL